MNEHTPQGPAGGPDAVPEGWEPSSRLESDVVDLVNTATAALQELRILLGLLNGLYATAKPLIDAALEKARQEGASKS